MCGSVHTWCIRLQYPDHEPFIFGTVLTMEERAEQALGNLWATLNPNPMPAKVALLPGYVQFCERRQA